MTTERDPMLPPGPVSFTIDLARLRQCSMRELHALHCAVNTVYETATGLSNEPRFANSDSFRDGHNRSGEIMQELSEVFGGYLQAIYTVAKAAQPTDSDEIHYRASLLITYDAKFPDELNGVAEIVIAALAALQIAKQAS